MRARNADLWSGLALAVLAVYIIVQASGWDYVGPDGPGAGFFPLWYGIAMLVLSAALVAHSLLRAPEAVDWRGAGRAAAVSVARTARWARRGRDHFLALCARGTGPESPYPNKSTNSPTCSLSCSSPC